MRPSLKELNNLPDADAKAEFLKCCGSPVWAERMTSERPFADVEKLATTADTIWWSLEASDWLEAFRSHPKIGETKAAADTSAHARKWSEAEQAGTRGSDSATREELARLNCEYEQKFGFIFIICATGKTADEMLQSLRERITHEAGAELPIAAAEQAKITQLRLNKLIDS